MIGVQIDGQIHEVSEPVAELIRELVEAYREACEQAGISPEFNVETEKGEVAH